MSKQPSAGAGLTNDVSRRTFLRGAGLASAAGLVGAAGRTSPFLASTSARAARVPPIILGVNAPNPWTGPAAGYRWPDLIPGAVGVRHYLNATSVGQPPGGVLQTYADVQSLMNFYDGGWPV